MDLEYANRLERTRDLLQIALFMSLPALVWFLFFSGSGTDATARALTGDEWRARYEAPLLEGRTPPEAPEAPREAGWTQYRER